jgi:nucleotide-binding universal stress UspA family protein
MLRSILVALDGSDYSESAIALALEWAGAFRASLVGLGVLDEPSIRGGEPVPLGASAYKQARDEARITEAHQRVLDVLLDFGARGQAAGIPTEVLEDVGDPAERIMREAQRCDLVILARETHFRFETQQRPDATLAEVLRGSPRPIVVVPRELPQGRGIVVAYHGGRECARTLQTFQLLGLAAGEEIQVFSVHPDAAEAQALAGLADAFLTAHGAPHRLHAIASGSPAVEVLLEAVRSQRPRLLVMGAHGHHPVRDLFSTSVTRAVLRECPVPVFVSA